MRILLAPVLFGLIADGNAVGIAHSRATASRGAEQTGGVASPAKSAQAARVEVTRRGRLRLSSSTRVCIETRIDADVRPRIEASGERVDHRAITAHLAGRVTEQFRRLGWEMWTDGGARRRVMTYVEVLGDASCLDRADNIIVRQRVAAAGARGYRVTLQASQGRQRYSVSLRRSRLLDIPAHRRRMIDLNAVRDPTFGTPFWDVAHDVHRLSRPLIDNIFGSIVS